MRMGKRTVLLLTVVAAMLFAFSGVVLAQQTDPKERKTSEKKDGKKVRPEHYIVVLKEDEDSAKKVADEHAAKNNAEVENVYESIFKGYSAKIKDEKQRQKIEDDPRVDFVEEDYEVQAFAQGTPTGVDRMEADQSSTLSGNGSGSVNVPTAIIDTGIQTNHPDLYVPGGKNCTTYGGSYSDAHGHGTHVAGSVGAKDDGQGVVGVAPGTPLYSVRVLGPSGSGYASWVNCGIDWVASNAASKGIKVANMSLGSSGSDRGNCGNGSDSKHLAICNAVNNKGVTFVVAAGNNNQNLAGFTPAAYDEVLTVTAESDSDGKPGGTGPAPSCRPGERDDYPATFSNWTTSGSTDEGHAIAAPGVCIKSTWTGSGYNTISGTSMASPHIAGAAALCLRSGGPCAGMTPKQVIAKLRDDAAKQLTTDSTYGFSASNSNSYAKLAYGKPY